MPEMTLEKAIELARLHQEQGRLAQAQAVLRQILEQAPGHDQVRTYLGELLVAAGDHVSALAEFQKAVQGNPANLRARTGLAGTLATLGRYPESIAAFREALALDNRPAFLYAHLGQVLDAAGQHAQAMDALREALRRDPSNQHYAALSGAMLHNAAFRLAAQARYREALDGYREAMALAPAHPVIHLNLGMALAATGQMEEAAVSYRRAIGLKPDYFEAYNNLGNALKELGRLDQALAAFQAALKLRPNSADLQSNLGSLFNILGLHDQALAAQRRALAADPQRCEFHGGLIFTLLMHPGFDAMAIRRELDCFNVQQALPRAPQVVPHGNDRSPERRLRIGYVSPDFRDHVVGRNILPLFLHHDHEPFEIYCYASLSNSDAMSARFQSLADHWRDITALSDTQAADLIRQDKIDILVDLALHTDGSRVMVLAYKPAPVQVTFAGYPGSTGLAAIDYRLTDVHLDPPGEHDEWYSEKSIRLPETFWCFDPLGMDFPVSPLPAAANKFITFGCLNNSWKINEQCLALWAKVLVAVANSRLVLLLPEGSIRERVAQIMKSHGVDPARLHFVSRRPRGGYMQLYHQIDIGLDTWPYNGHSTSLDSYWMGVPAVTLVGKTVVGRAGLSQLTNLGLNELIARDPEQFVQIAGELAQDIPRLNELRAGLRERMKVSPLMNATAFARNIESAYRQMWRNWCGGTL